MIYVHLKHSAFIFSFCSALNLFFKIFPLICTLFCDMVLLMWDRFYTAFGTLLHDAYCAKVPQINTFWSAQNTAHKHTDKMLYMQHNT